MSTDVSRGPRARRDPAPARRTPAPPAGDLIDSPRFQEAVKGALANEQQRANLRHATTTIRNKRAQVVAELDNWQELRQAGEQIKTRVGRHMPDYLLQFEENFTKAGGSSTGHATPKRRTGSSSNWCARPVRTNWSR